MECVCCVARRGMGSLWSWPIGANFGDRAVVVCIRNVGCMVRCRGPNPDTDVRHVGMLLLLCCCMSGRRDLERSPSADPTAEATPLTMERAPPSDLARLFAASTCSPNMCIADESACESVESSVTGKAAAAACSAMPAPREDTSLPNARCMSSGSHVGTRG